MLSTSGTPFDAIAPGTNLSQHASDLLRMHDALLGGSRAAMVPRAVVSRSWSRMLRSGMDAAADNARDPLSREEVLRRRSQSPLKFVVRELIQVIIGIGDASRFLMVVTDANGVILWRAGSATIRNQADWLGFSEGAEWTEAVVGTNAIGTALVEAAPVQLFAGEHFENKQQAWYCSASPVHDPRDGKLLGIVNVSGPALTLHPAIGALVATAVRLAESQLWRHNVVRLERLRASAEHLLATVNGPVLLVDVDGWVAHHTGMAARDRVAVPQPGTLLAVPGMGLCLPEKVADGWLIRPCGGDRRIFAFLDLSGAATLEVRSDGGPWRSAVSPRHAEVLELLHDCGPAGLSARQLSQALYGDGEHVVTVRAEISRLRRGIGALVATRPYRLAEGVTLTIVRPLPKP